MLANATTAMLYSSPGRGACALCAKKKLEVQIQCHLWKAFPGGDAGELAEEREAEEDATTEESPQASAGKEPQRRRRRRLRDADGVYITLAT